MLFNYGAFGQISKDLLERRLSLSLGLRFDGSDYSEDLRIGPEVLKRHADIYRRLRNTLRFVLGNLEGFDKNERLDIAEMPELERWILHRLWVINKSELAGIISISSGSCFRNVLSERRM